MAANNKMVTLKLLVDTEKKRVVLAESAKDFVDILFSFLTLPMGTIVRLLKKPSVLGCLSNLYESVEKLDARHFNTEACKTMLLWPRSEAVALYENLKINIDDTMGREFYICSSIDCNRKKGPVDYSRVLNTRCSHCGKFMNSAITWNNENSGSGADDGVFIKGGASFMFTDDLRVTEASTSHAVALLNKFGIKDKRRNLQERSLYLGRPEVLNLLGRSLVSTTPLSDIYFCNTGMEDAPTNLDMKEIIHPKTEPETVKESQPKRIITKLIMGKAYGSVVYVEAGEEMMNLLFSFLTFPLGSVIRLLKENLSKGCIDNIYRSAKDLSIQYFKSQELKRFLLFPKLAPFYSYRNKLLEIDEVSSYGGRTCAKRYCYWKNVSNRRCAKRYCYWKNVSNYSFFSPVKCQHGYGDRLHELNPKLPKGETGSGFAKRLGKFIVTDSLNVVQLTPISVMQAANNSKLPYDEIVEREVGIGQIQALNLVRAALTSESALTNVLCSS